MPNSALILGLIVGAGGPLTASLAPASAPLMAPLAAAPANAASPLAPSLQGKPVVVEIYASWCSACQSIKPVLETLRKKEGSAIHWIQFDVSNTASAKSSAAQAKKLGLAEFFKRNRSQTSLVSIINPETGTVVNTFRAQPKLDPYLKAIQTTRSLLQR